MGRNLDRNQSILQFEKNYKGCILGLIPLQFQSFKKFMPLTKTKYEKPSKPSLMTESKESDEGQVLEVGNSDSRFIAIENISIHTFKEGRPIKGKVPGRPRLKRTYSIHHLEPESYYPVVNQNISTQPRTYENADVLDDEQIVRCSKNFGEQDLLDQVNHHSCGHREPPVEAYEDFFDAFQIDKKLLMKSTQTSDVDYSTQYQGELKYPERSTFRRSGSFPMANRTSSRYGGLMPSNLQTKLTEVWQSPSSSSSSSVSSSSLPSLETNFPTAAHLIWQKNIFGDLAAEKDPRYRTDHRESDYASDVRRYKLSRIRRATSLNESLERYTQLYDTSFKKGAKLNFSKSLRVSNGDDVGYNPYDSVYLRKVQSMREALQAEWLSDSIELSEIPNKSTTLSIDSEKVDYEINTHESLAGFEEQDLILLDEQQITYNFDPYIDTQPQLSVEYIKTAPSNQDFFVEDSGLGIESRDTFSYEHNVLNILKALKTRNSTSTVLNSDLREELLSDLVNEALVDVYSVYDACWPTPLCYSASSHMNPLLNTTHHVTRNVLTRIAKLENISQKSSDSTDNVVNYDLAQGNGWMNLLADADSLGLAIDELIFDELIDELKYE